MASYATYSDMLSRYPAVAGRKGGATSVNSDLLDRATNFVNGALAPKYSTPFSDTTGTVRDLAMDVAYFYFLLDANIEKAKMFREVVIDPRVKAILAGEENIINDSGAVGMVTDNVIWSENADYPPAFSMLDPESGFSGVSSDRLEAERDERS